MFTNSTIQYLYHKIINLDINTYRIINNNIKLKACKLNVNYKLQNLERKKIPTFFA